MLVAERGDSRYRRPFCRLARIFVGSPFCRWSWFLARACEDHRTNRGWQVRGPERVIGGELAANGVGAAATV